MPTSNTDRTAYNKFPYFDEYSYKIITHLLDNNQTIWKLLNYTTPGAWNEPNLSTSDKVGLIYKGSGKTSDYKVFMDDGPPDVVTEEMCQLRIHPFGLFPVDRTNGDLTIMAEVYSHFKINTLDNYRTRVDMIIRELLDTLNGEQIAGIGRLVFSKPGVSSTRMESSGQIPYKGKWILFGQKI